MALTDQPLQSIADTLREWAPNIPDKDRLAEMVLHIESIAATARGDVVPSDHQRALGEIRQALLKLHLKSDRELRMISNTAIEILFPGSNFACDFRVSGFSDWVQFKVDVAYMLVCRDDDFSRRSIKFGWGDSSPQGPFDILLWKARCIYADQLLEIADAVVKLVNTPGGVIGGETGDDAEIPLETADVRAAANEVLTANIREHLYAPFCSVAVAVIAVVVVAVVLLVFVLCRVRCVVFVCACELLLLLFLSMSFALAFAFESVCPCVPVSCGFWCASETIQ